MPVAANKATIRRLIEELYNGGNLAVAAEIFAADAVHHGAGDWSSAMVGPDAIKQAAVSWRTAFPDFHVTLDAVVGDGDAAGGVSRDAAVRPGDAGDRAGADALRRGNDRRGLDHHGRSGLARAAQRRQLGPLSRGCLVRATTGTVGIAPDEQDGRACRR